MNKRSIPEWMKTNSLDIPSISVENSDTNNSDSTQPKRRLRSNFSFDDNSKQETVAPILKPINYPPIKYDGKIHYHSDMMDIAFACDQMLTWVNKHPNEIVPVAFDMEWPFSFKTGPGRSSVIQLCADVTECYVLHLSNLKKLPVALLELLTNPKILLHGVNIKNDCRKLSRDFPEANGDKMIERCRDLGVWTNDVLDTSGRWSLERLVSEICKLKIDKNKAVRMSQWHVQPLNDVQKLYAAIDVYISQVIYHELEKREREKAVKIAEFVDLYGEDALKLVNSLK